jgi:alpha-tubulin suppressor-like RCC1 family protein
VLAVPVLVAAALAGAGAVPGTAAASARVPRWLQVAAGGNFTCGIREGNTLWCWGAPDFGDLGTGAVNQKLRPQQIGKPTSGWASVATGAGHTCAIRADGTLWCWGFGSDGELGTGATTDQGLPQQVTSPAADGWASVAAGAGHTCAVRADGTLWCWGSGFFGQLGAGAVVDQPLPQQVTTPAADGWTSVATGAFATCALRTHALWCWGDNDDGELGIGGTASQSVPRRVPVPSRNGWLLIAPGDFHACALRTGHTLWCWGYNAAGELGQDSTTQEHRAQQVTA